MDNDDQLKKYVEDMRKSLEPPSKEEMERRYLAATRLRELYLSSPGVHELYRERDRKYGMKFWLRMQGSSPMNNIRQPDGTYR